MTSSTFLRTQTDKLLSDKLVLEQLKQHVEERSDGDIPFSRAAVNPEAIIAAVSTIIDIINFFSGGEDPLEKVVNAMRQEIEYVIELIKEVIELLREIKEIIHQEVVEFVDKTIKGQIRSILDFFDSWKENLDKPATITDITTRLILLSNNTRTAFDYGYAHYDSIGMAFSTEFLLAKLLRTDERALKNIANTYLNGYFLKALNAMALSINGVVNHMQTLEERYKETTVFTGVDTTTSSTRTCYYNNSLVVTGSVKDGFSFTPKRVLDHCDRDPDPVDHGTRGHKDFLERTTHKANSVTGIIEEYNNAFNEYHNKYIPELKHLNQAIGSVQKYIAVIRSFTT
jgi:hypothetical protein